MLLDTIKLSVERLGELQIMIAVVLFGITFIFQRRAMLIGMGPISFNACRFAISALLMLIVGPITSPLIHTAVEQSEDQNQSEVIKRWNYNRDLMFWGVLCGLSGFGGSMLQQIGIVNLTAGKTGFITGMFVIFVPIVEWLTPGFGADLTAKSWLACLGSMFGLYLLSGCSQTESCLDGASGRSEILVFISMLFWTVGIMWCDVGAKKVNAISLMTVNFVIITVLTIIVAYIYESEDLRYPFTTIRENWLNIFITGAFEAIAFCFATMGQRYTSPTKASILFSLESVACAIFSFICLNERLSYIEIVGACFMAGSGIAARDFTEKADVNELEVRSRRHSEIETEKGDVEMELPLWKEHPNFGSTKDNQHGIKGLGYVKLVDNSASIQ